LFTVELGSFKVHILGLVCNLCVIYLIYKANDEI